MDYEAMSRAYSEHWNHCSDCKHQAWCETGYNFKEALLVLGKLLTDKGK